MLRLLFSFLLLLAFAASGLLLAFAEEAPKPPDKPIISPGQLQQCTQQANEANQALAVAASDYMDKTKNVAKLQMQLYAANQKIKMLEEAAKQAKEKPADPEK